MSKNKLAKFADMATYPHVIEAPDIIHTDQPFPLRGRWHNDFSTMTVLSSSNSAVAAANTP